MVEDILWAASRNMYLTYALAVFSESSPMHEDAKFLHTDNEDSSDCMDAEADLSRHTRQ